MHGSGRRCSLPESLETANLLHFHMVADMQLACSRWLVAAAGSLLPGDASSQRLRACRARNGFGGEEAVDGRLGRVPWHLLY